MNNQPIGIMDSGIGGLTAVKALIEKLPNESLIYVGDNARLPYGPRQPEEVARFVVEIGKFLENKGAKLLLIACNTATVAGLYIAQQSLSIPVIGMIEPGTIQAVETTQNHHYVVFATEGTVNSHAYQKAIQKMDVNAKVTEIACPAFVTLVEQNHWNDSLAKQAIHDALNQIEDEEADTLILGCTHFPILEECMSEMTTMNFVNPGKASIKQIEQTLKETNQQADKTKGEYVFYTTGDKEGFAFFIEKWLGIENYKLRRLKEEELMNGNH